MGLRAGQRLVLPQLQLLEHLCGGTAAVIAHTREPEGLIHARGALPSAAVSLNRQGVTVGADRCRGQSQQFTAAAAAPAEQAVGERLAAVPGELVGAEPLHPGTAGHGGQACTEAKADRQPTEVVRPFGKTGAAVGLAKGELLQQGSGADQHAIALHPGAIDRLEAPGLHRRPQPRKQSRAVLLNPGVERRGGVGEVELREALHQGERRFKGAHSGLPGVGHRPQPGQIQMGVAQHLHRARRLRLLLLPQPRLQHRCAGGISWIKRIQLFQQSRLGLSRQTLRRQGQPRPCQHPTGIG